MKRGLGLWCLYNVTFNYNVEIRVMVLNATFNNISVISWRSENILIFLLKNKYFNDLPKKKKGNLVPQEKKHT